LPDPPPSGPGRGAVARGTVADRLDVALVVRLRPAALVVPARDVVRPVRDLDEPARHEPEHLAALAADGRDEDVVTAPDDSRQRREIQLVADLHVVDDGLADLDRAPEVVEAVGEDGQPANAVTVEVGAEPATDPLDVPAQGRPALVVEPGAAALQPPLGLAEQRADPHLDVPG